MACRRPWIGVITLLVLCSSEHALACATLARQQKPEAAMSDDVRRMHERLTALSRGEGSFSDFRFEFMDGSGMSSHRSFNVEGGQLVSKEWTSPGSSMIHRHGRVTDTRLAKLLEDLIANQYWSFQGTRFVPDAPMFLFRFYDRELSHVDFRCDAEEFRQSEARAAIRDLFLKFVSETERKPAAK